MGITWKGYCTYRKESFEARRNRAIDSFESCWQDCGTPPSKLGHIVGVPGYSYDVIWGRKTRHNSAECSIVYSLSRHCDTVSYVNSLHGTRVMHTSKRRCFVAGFRSPQSVAQLLESMQVICQKLTNLNFSHSLNFVFFELELPHKNYCGNV